jgi:hypothetical protein
MIAMHALEFPANREKYRNCYPGAAQFHRIPPENRKFHLSVQETNRKGTGNLWKTAAGPHQCSTKRQFRKRFKKITGQEQGIFGFPQPG